jgi:hypothetical protein
MKTTRCKVVEDGCAIYYVNHCGEGWLHEPEEGSLGILREEWMLNNKVKPQHIN